MRTRQLAGRFGSEPGVLSRAAFLLQRPIATPPALPRAVIECSRHCNASETACALPRGRSEPGTVTLDPVQLPWHLPQLPAPARDEPRASSPQLLRSFSTIQQRQNGSRGVFKWQMSALQAPRARADVLGTGRGRGRCRRCFCRRRPEQPAAAVVVYVHLLPQCRHFMMRNAVGRLSLQESFAGEFRGPRRCCCSRQRLVDGWRGCKPVCQLRGGAAHAGIWLALHPTLQNGGPRVVDKIRHQQAVAGPTGRSAGWRQRWAGETRRYRLA